MKTLNYFILAFTIIITSCSSSEGIETAIDDKLSEINAELGKLELNTIKDLNHSEDTFSNLEFKNSKKKKASNCSHEEIYPVEYFGEEKIETTIKYFDKNGNKRTSCDVDNDFGASKYITEETIKITGTDYVYDLFQKNNYDYQFSISESSFYVKSSIKSEITGTLNFNGSIFNIVEGSKANILLELNEFNDELEFDDILPSIDLLYKLEFDVENNTYHFDMTIDTEDILAIEQSNTGIIEFEYDLFNSSNQKIGTVKYIQNERLETEKFEVYDLDGNKVQ